MTKPRLITFLQNCTDRNGGRPADHALGGSMCLDGKDAISKRRIEEALGDPGEGREGGGPEPPARTATAENFDAYSTQTAVGDRQGP